MEFLAQCPVWHNVPGAHVFSKNRYIYDNFHAWIEFDLLHCNRCALGLGRAICVGPHADGQPFPLVPRSSFLVLHSSLSGRATKNVNRLDPGRPNSGMVQFKVTVIRFTADERGRRVGGVGGC